MRRLALALLPLLAVAACTAGRAAPPALSTPTPLPSVSTPAGGIVTVQRAGREVVEYYRVDAKRHARLLKRVRGPRRGQVASAVTLSAGQRPDSCVAWSTLGEDGSEVGGDIRCYAYDDTVGRAITMRGTPESVALRPDGRAIFWIVDHDAPPGGGDVDLVTASYQDGSVSSPQVHPSVRDGKAVDGFGCDAESGVWSGADTVLLNCPSSVDFDGGIVVQPLHGAGRPLNYPPGRSLFGVESADATSALVPEGEDCSAGCTFSGPSRAVRIELATGHVLEVIAVAARGRTVDAVSGGARGIFYQTANDRTARFYLRLPGESHGVPISGLPTDSGWLVAQP